MLPVSGLLAAGLTEGELLTLGELEREALLEGEALLLGEREPAALSEGEREVEGDSVGALDPEAEPLMLALAEREEL